MRLLQLDHWPILFICAGMIVCAVVDWWKFKVPNVLTFPLILSGWLLGLLHDLGLASYLGEAGKGGIGAAVVGTFFGMALLYPMYMIGGVGGGDVKMQMAFGSWIGAFYSLESGLTLWIVLFSFLFAGLIGGVLGLIMMIVRGKYQENIAHLRVIFVDLVTLGKISKIAEAAKERRPRWHKLPYGIPLCIGFIGYLFLAATLAARSSPPASESQHRRKNGASAQVGVLPAKSLQPILSLQSKELKLSGAGSRK
ncbi:MAG: prepilin peptidase [Gemmatales bacterium]|nr:MAG: prepilin peptidase [Gemmatales bacterium]